MKRLSVPTGIAVATALCIAGSAQAHISMIQPDGGERLEANSVYSVEWIIIISHGLQNWDLWYSHESPTGPWIEVATDLTPGDPTPGTIHSYDWTIPEEVDSSVWFRVRMDNVETDYEAISAKSFEITLPCPADVDDDGNVAFGDLLLILSSWGPCAEDCPADIDESAAVDFLDLLRVLSDWGDCGES